jgi:autotransporter-associated beta strand protein
MPPHNPVMTKSLGLRAACCRFGIRSLLRSRQPQHHRAPGIFFLISHTSPPDSRLSRPKRQQAALSPRRCHSSIDESNPLRILSSITFSLCLALCLGSASATTYYVELTGNDANSGLVGSPWRTLAKACADVPADQGHVIQIGEGTFTEAGILTLRSGVSLIGAGSTKTILRVNHYFSLTDAVPNANPHVDTFPEQFVIQMNGQNQTVKGFALDGQTKTCHGGIFAALARNVVFEDLNVTNFRYCALWMLDAYDTTLRFSNFKNNTYGNRNSGDSGAVQYLRCFNLAIHDNRVEETGNVSPDLGGYALKAQDRSWEFSSNNVLDSMRIYNNTLIVPTVGAWENGLAPAISAEFLNVGMRNCEIYHNTINNTVSMAGNSRGTRNRIHHNFFNLGRGRYAYAIEASMSDLEIDQNHFYGGLYPIALWGGNPQNHNIHHNIFEAASAGVFAGQALLNYSSPITNLRFINNTVIDNGGIGQIFALHASSTYEARNNLIIHTAASADIWGTNLPGTVSNNFFSNVTPRGTNALTGAPGISYSLVSGTPLSPPYYTIEPGSPLLDAGQSISPWADDFTGTAPDIGAIESGVPFASNDYFVSPTGNDSATGTSDGSAWKTLDKVNSTTFQPGDRIRFKKGGTWVGSLWPKGSGDSTAQITLGSYGTGAKPLIDAQGAETAVIKLSNQEYWTIDGFEVTNWAATNGMRFGIRVEASDNLVKHRIRILNNTVRDIYGIMGMPEADGTTGYWVGGIYFQINEPGRADEVLIEGNDVRNIIGEAISFWGEWENAGGGMNYANCSPNVVVRKNTVLRTSGDGILILGTDNELVEYNVVGYVSELQTQSVNTAAAWPTRHIGGLWQYNHVHHTRRKGNDGTAFDNDGFTSGTTIFQHNVSHDNEGGFIMEYTWGGDISAKTIARYNISWNDSRIVASNRGGMELYNNVFYNPDATLGVEWTAAGTRVNFRNNIFVAAGHTADFGSQNFYNTTFSGEITWPTTANSNRTRDPLFVKPNTTGNLAGFILQAGSSERSTGAVITSNGSKDFWGITLPTSAPHRGASQINVIDDYTATPTFLTASGPSTATIPLSGSVTLAFTAELRDQNFHLISPPAVTWSLSPAASGYSIDSNGVVTISSTAQSQRIAVVATSGSLTSSASFGTAYQTSDWDNGAGTGKWNATDTNWSGSTWSDGGWAVFSHTATPQTITLEGTRSALRVDVGNGGNNANYTFASAPGASLTTDTFVIQGDPGNDANSAPLTIFDNAAITVAGNLGIGRARLSIAGSSVIQAGTIGGGGIAFSPKWGYLTLSGNANVTATNGIYGNTSAWGINLNGGTLTTKGINASDYSTLGAYLHFNGTTVRASESNPAFVTLSNGTKAYIGTGGANIDTNGQDIGIAAILADASSASPATNGGTTLSGTGFLTKSGLGTLVLTQAPTYSGATTVSAGTLVASNGFNGATAVTISSGATLRVDAAAGQGRAASFGGAGTLIFNPGSGSGYSIGWSPGLTLQMSPGGLIRVQSGTATQGYGYTYNWGGNQAGMTIDSGAVFDTWDGVSIRIDALNGAGTLQKTSNASWLGAANINLGVANGSGSFTGNITNSAGTFNLVKSGSGTQILAGNNTYNGTTTVNGGTLQIGDGGTTGTLGGGGVTNNAALVFNRSDSPTVANPISGSGSVTKAGTGTLTLSGPNSYTGNTTVSAGTLRLGNGTAPSNLAGGADVIVATGATLDLNFLGTDEIRSLTLGGQTVAPGIYTASVSNFITGTGTLTVTVGPAPANTSSVTWDTTLAMNGIITAGSGTWNNLSGNWNNGSTSFGVNWSNTDLDTATFQAGDDSGAYAVTAGGPITVGVGTNARGGLNFLNSGYTLSAASAQTIELRRGSTGSGFIRVASGKTATVGNNITITRNDNFGNLTFIGGGTLIFDAGSTLNQPSANANEVAGGTTLQLNGGIATFATSFVIGELTAGNGPNGSVQVDSGSFSVGGTGNLVVGRVAGDISNLTINGGSVSVNGGIVRTDNGIANIQLNGGSLSTKQISRSNGTLNLSFSGGTLTAASGASASFLNNFTTVTIHGNGGTIDTNGQTISIAQSLSAGTGSGGFTKQGPGTLALAKANTYTGDTTVSMGTLRLGNGTTSGNLADDADVIIAPGAMLDLYYTGTDQIRSLWVDGSQLPPGIYLSTSAFLTGTGTLTVTTGPAMADYAGWSGRGGYNLSGNPSGDDDNDSIANLLEYVLGGNPRAASSGILPTATASSGNLVFTFRRIRSTTAETTQVFQYGTDLSGWTDVPIVAGGMVAIQPDTPQVGTDTVTITVPEGTQPRIFGRLKVTGPPAQP